MTGLQDAFAFFRAIPFRNPDQIIGFSQRRSQRFFDQQIESRIQQRSNHMVIGRRLLAGAKIPLIVSIDAISNGFEATRPPQLFHQREELIFAKKTALRIVPDVFRAIELRSCNYLQRDALLLRKSDRVIQLSACQTGRIGDNRQHLVSQFPMSGPREEGGIDSAGVGDQRSSRLIQGRA